MSCNLKKKFENSKFDFVGKFKYMIIAPVAIMLVALIVLCCIGFNKGIEFTGGTMVNVFVGEELEQNQVFENSKQKIDQVLNQNGLKASIYQINTTDVGLCLSVRYQDKTGITEAEMEELNTKVTNELFTAFGYDKENVEQKNYVLGSQRIDASVGSELLVNSLTAILIASVLIGIYMLFRFGVTSSLSAFLCVEHDILIAISSVIIFRLELSSSIVSVLVAVLALSFFNNIQLFSTIKQNLKEEALNNKFVANNSIKQSSYRIILVTSFAIIGFLALSLFGIKFALTLSLPVLVGILANLYSTLFLAPALWAFAYVPKKRKVKEVYKNKENGVV